MPKEIAIIIRYRTSGGRNNPRISDGEIVQVIRDGTARDPTSTDPEIAYKWLMANDYHPAGFKWVDVAGHVRRRKQTYRKE